ncbi:uncharacterized protein YcfL [Ereboglobus sp. PH5-5]|uniref:YcfL family protein n=1 Tax=Ereboglobus sp. PH5-5 TaxID=2940529 RepID=UPI002406B4B6|nr:YcfL family protein [Ereboglobus sp. PH5-5]MDF9832862.1 uncharacterized protein YcfL [Ereboglobus sp. PH5-5]
MKTLLSVLAIAAALFVTAGCASKNTHGTGPYLPQDTTKYTIENTENFVLMDQAAQYSITCTGLQPRTTPDGRLEIVANVKNREARRVQVQISCVFKDAQRFSTGDETPWQTLILGENATEVVRFTASNAQSKTYTIRVRQSR